MQFLNKFTPTSYRFSIHIDNINKEELSKEKGISFKKFGELVTALSKCLETDKVTFTITAIEDGSYAPVCVTEQEDGANNFVGTHKAIQELDFSELTHNQKNYAAVLRKLFFSEGLYIKVYQGEKLDEKLIAELKEILHHKQPQNYYSVTTISGKICTLNGVNDVKPYVIVKYPRKNDILKIFVNEEQESQIRDSGIYKRENIKFKVRIKKFFLEEKEDEASLISFTIPSGNNFIESIEQAREKFGDIFKNINDPASYIKKLRQDELYE